MGIPPNAAGAATAPTAEAPPSCTNDIRVSGGTSTVRSRGIGIGILMTSNDKVIAVFVGNVGMAANPAGDATCCCIMTCCIAAGRAAGAFDGVELGELCGAAG